MNGKEISFGPDIGKPDDIDEYDKALEFLDLSKDDIDKKSFISHKIDSGLQEKVTQISQFAMDFRMLLEGKTYKEEKGGYMQTGPALSSKDSINKLVGIVQNYSQNANLISKKDDEKFSIQLYDAWTKAQNVLLRDRATPEKNHRVILKIFKDCLVNIGDIITNTDQNMSKIFSAFQNNDNLNMNNMPLGKGF